MKPLSLYVENGRIVCEFSVFVESRAMEGEAAFTLIERGLRRMEGEYETACGAQTLEVRINRAEAFSISAVNVRVTDSTPVIRRWYDPRINVSRQYIGTRRRGIFKFWRWVFRKPDIFINLAGRNPDFPPSREAIISVVQHEFGHVLGLRDQYRRRDQKKRRPEVADCDIMYRTGPGQAFMGYQIERIKLCAARGSLPRRTA